MGYKGGRGGFGSTGYAKAEPFVIFPEITLPDLKSISNDSQLLSSYLSFQKFWRNSPNYLGDGVSKQEHKGLEMERFSNSLKQKKPKKSGSFYDYLVLRSDNFPKELLGDTGKEQPVKKAKWTQDADLQKLDVFEKLEAKYKIMEAEGKEQKEDNEKVEESEESDNGDYDQNQDFDDDDDDYNQVEADNDEQVY